MKKLKQKLNLYIQILKFNTRKLFVKVAKPQLTAVQKIFINDKLVSLKYADSLLGNFTQLLYCKFANNDVNFADSGAPWNSHQNAITSNGVSYRGDNYWGKMDAGAGSLSTGIVFDADSVPPTSDETLLGATYIQHGNGAGQLDYFAMVGTGAQISGDTTSFTVRRIANNNSGASIQVNSVKIRVFNDLSNNAFLIYKDLVDVLVENGDDIRAEITFSNVT